jgi:hypothetical protein
VGNDSKSRSDGEDRPSLTKEDIRLGTKAQKLVQQAIVICFFILLAIALIVVSQVPLGTTASYTRLSRDFQIPPYALLLFPLTLGIIWLKGREPEAGRIPRSERIVMIVLAVTYLSFSLVAQCYMAITYLQAGGAV